MDPVMDYIMGWSTPALICLIAGLILMVCEMFTPGMGIPGILGGLCLLGAIVPHHGAHHPHTHTAALNNRRRHNIPLLLKGRAVPLQDSAEGFHRRRIHPPRR